jgi:pimeloyl-ACP methyl ester carboxylesterase
MSVDRPQCRDVPEEAAVLGLLALLAMGFPPSDPPRAKPVVRPAEFQAWFEKAREGRLSIPAGVAANAAQYRYVFVGGFRNEGLPGYFAQNAHEMRSQGISRSSIHFIYPSSRETVEGNAREVCSRFHETASIGPERLVVIAHSRGACDALAFALQYPEFVDRHVHSMFLVQGPFGGSAVADFVVGEGQPMDGRIPLGHRIVAQLLARAETYLMERGTHGGLAALTTRASERFWQRLLEENERAISVVSPKTFFVTSQTTPSQLRILQRAAAWYLETYCGPNDGMVALQDQIVPDLGTVVAVLDAGHTDLTNRFPVGARKRKLRKALVDTIIMSVGSGAPADSPLHSPVHGEPRND